MSTGSNLPRDGQPVLVDTHLHMWDLERCSYDWLTNTVSPINRTLLPSDVRPELDEAGVSHAVLVQAANTTCDTDSMVAAANRHDWIIGVVGWIDLTGGAAVTDTALALVERAPVVVGIRHLIHVEPDPDWLAQPPVLAGLRSLASVGLSFDVVSVLPRHLEHVDGIAGAIPELRLVIDHLSKPPLTGGDFPAWERTLRRVAARPNVFAKISGLDTASPQHWTVETLRPAFLVALEAFGPSRLLYGGDWPISVLGGGYARQFDAFEELIADLSPNEKEQIRWRNAADAYRLRLP